MKTLIVSIVVFLSFIALDLAWFKVAGNFFKSEIGSIARLTESGEWNIRYIPALVVYALMTLGLLVFVLPYATSLPHALMLGALFGLVGYGLYDMTNLATLSAWTMRFAILDMAWGTALLGAVAGIGYATRVFIQTV